MGAPPTPFPAMSVWAMGVFARSRFMDWRFGRTPKRPVDLARKPSTSKSPPWTPGRETWAVACPEEPFPAARTSGFGCAGSQFHLAPYFARLTAGSPSGSMMSAGMSMLA
jgi:hypothetical protein